MTIRRRPVTVFQGGLYCRTESHHLTQVLDPVIGIAIGLFARVDRGRRIVGNGRRRRFEVVQNVGQLIEDRIDLR